jgi:hypothetical protein
VTHKQVAEDWSRVLKKEVKYEQISYDDAKESFMDMGMPEWQAEGINELYQLMDDNDPVINDENNHILHVSGRDPISPEAWMSYHRAAFM